LFGPDVPTSIEDAGSSNEVVDPEAPTEEPGTGAEREDDLIDQLVEAFTAADEAGAEGDLVGQATALEQAGELARQLQELRRQQRTEADGATTSTTEAPATTTSTAPPTTTEVPASTTTTSAGA
ncbi:MAG: hypothetical protein R2743_26480, partial [Ilumatobacteraceae bacterium]